jgi:hypothetical protein
MLNTDIFNTIFIKIIGDPYETQATCFSRPHTFFIA